jgi:REP element-mobilizing transposase RayT
MVARSLTNQQQHVLSFMEDFARQHGFPPTLREIGHGVGLVNVNAVRGHLAALQRKGYITRTPDKARSVQITRPTSAVSRFKRRLHQLLHTDEGVLHQVVYGLAWTTSERHPCLRGEAASCIHEALKREMFEHGWTLLDVNVQADHVVVVVQVWPNHSPRQAVHRLQSACQAAWRRHHGADRRKELWDQGFAVTTDLDRLDELVAKLLGESSQGSGPDSGGIGKID